MTILFHFDPWSVSCIKVPPKFMNWFVVHWDLYCYLYNMSRAPCEKNILPKKYSAILGTRLLSETKRSTTISSTVIILHVYSKATWFTLLNSPNNSWIRVRHPILLRYTLGHLCGLPVTLCRMRPPPTFCSRCHMIWNGLGTIS